MNGLGSLGFLGSAYMFFLLALLVVALGAGVNYIANAALNVLDKGNATSSQKNYTTIFKGGYKIMENNQWLRYALYSFLGILLLMAVGGLMTGNQQPMYGRQGMAMPGMNMGGGGMPMQGYGMPQVILVPVAVMPTGQMGMPMGQMQGNGMGMPMGMQGGSMGMMGGMPMGQSGNMGQMQGGGGMGMMMPMGMQGGGMGMMNMGGQGGGMGNMQQSGSGMSGGSSGGGMGGMM